jgi:acyl-CoA synthetase (AMP-forming)/AMP-acid ligase II
VFQIADDRAFLTAFWACQLGGIVPVLVPVHRSSDTVLRHVLDILEGPVVLRDAPHIDPVSAIETSSPNVIRVPDPRSLDDDRSPLPDQRRGFVATDPLFPAFIVLTSGISSTTVVVHRHLRAFR